MVADQTIWSFITEAGPVVKVVMSILFIASVASWTFIFQRGFYYKNTRRDMEQFEKQFWSGGDLAQLYRRIDHRGSELEGLEAIFYGGFREFVRLRQSPNLPMDNIIGGVQRAMRVSAMEQLNRLEKHLSFLATVGSTSPYIGLFGTVWGIMTSFQALGGAQQVTIAMVAPGISEALVATAIGLFAAIPAVIAYNRYANKVDSILNRYDTFQEELVNILYRQMGNPDHTHETAEHIL